MSRKIWMPREVKVQKHKIPDSIKETTLLQAQQFVVTIKKERLREPPENPEYNYVIDLWVKWYRSYLHFGATYACPSPRALSPTFETYLARMEYVGNNLFNLAYMRHTGKWHEIFYEQTLKEALELIRREPHFLGTI